MQKVPVTVRDGRFGFDLTQPTTRDAPILMTLRLSEPLHVGDFLTLPGGDVVEIAAAQWDFGPRGRRVGKTVHVRDV
jgi:hypothetical protein